jgi:hypothetical protein
VNRIGLPARCLAECQKLACASSCPLLRRYAEATTCFSIPDNRSNRPFNEPQIDPIFPPITLNPFLAPERPRRRRFVALFTQS